MMSLEGMSVAELEALAGRVERQKRERRLEERVERELPGRARFPHPEGERLWLEVGKKRCGSKYCKKGCAAGKPAHGPYWRIYEPKDGTKNGLGVRQLGRELPAEEAAEFGLPAGLEASHAHQYSRDVRKAEILRDAARAMNAKASVEAKRTAEVR